MHNLIQRDWSGAFNVFSFLLPSYDANSKKHILNSVLGGLIVKVKTWIFLPLIG